MIIDAGRHCIIIKKDIKDAFRNIPVAPHMQWLLGLKWEDNYYKEACLPFGLSTAPFIFNLYAEAFHWILQSYCHWDRLVHYLDDFIHVVPSECANKNHLATLNSDYNTITDCLGIPRNESKDHAGTVVPIFGIEVDTVASLS